MPIVQRFRLDNLTNEDEAREFIAWCCGQLGLGFHPDTCLSDYEDTNGMKVFPREAAERYEALMEQAYQLLEDPSEVALEMPPFASAEKGPTAGH